MLVFVFSTPATSLHVTVVTAALAITSTLLVRPVGAVLCGPLAVLPGFVHQLGDVIASPGATLQASTASSRGGDHGLALAVVAGAVAVVIVVLTSSSRETRGRTSTGPAVAQHAGSSTAWPWPPATPPERAIHPPRAGADAHQGTPGEVEEHDGHHGGDTRGGTSSGGGRRVVGEGRA